MVWSNFHSHETFCFPILWVEAVSNPSRDRKGAATSPLADARGSVPGDVYKCKLL